MALKQGLVPIVSIGILLVLPAAGGQGELWAQEKARLLFEEIPVVITASSSAAAFISEKIKDLPVIFTMVANRLGIVIPAEILQKVDEVF